ncbi:TPA: hypothetical protein QIB15_004408 [Klebsiella aerogenes]|nr:hypothetical protein [Klebsiella aerogenes]
MNINEKPQWESEVKLLTRQEKVEGGVGGAANIQASQLANRTQYLKSQIEAYNGLLKSGELPFTSEADAAAAIAAGKIPEGAIFSIRSDNPLRWVDEFKNINGEIVGTGKFLPSALSVTPLITPTDDDPDGTIAGLASTVEGQRFYVVAELDGGSALMLYQNQNNAAHYIDIFTGKWAIDELRDEVMPNLTGVKHYTGDNHLRPIAVDEENNIALGYDKEKSEVFGDGLVTESNIHNTIQAAPGIKKYNGSRLMPVATDGMNNLLFNYDPDLDEMQGVGLVSESVMAKGYSAKKFTGTGIYPLFTDEKNNLLVGYDADKDRAIVVGLEFTGTVPVYIDEPLPFHPLARLINQILVYGQSLAAGRDGIPLLSTAQPFSNLTYIGGVRGGGLNAQDFSASKPLVEDSINPSPDGGTSRGETVCSGAANYASLAAYVENGIDPASHVIFASSAGKSGAPIGDLKKGTAWYNEQFMAHVTGAHAFNSDVAVQVIMWLQGESNSDGRIPDGTRAAYKATLRQLRIDAEADIKVVTGQTTPVPFIVYQHSTNIRTNTNTCLAFYDLITEKDSMFFFATPLYMFPHAADGLHMTAVGYKWAGCYYGRAYKQMMHDRIRPRFIRPISAVYAGGAVRVKFNVPKAPLVLDTVNLAPTQDYGFSVYSSGSKVVINAVGIENGDTVVIETSEASLSDVVVKYGIDYLGEGLNIQAGASGNLRDSTPGNVVIDGVSRPFFYLCPHLEINAINGAI